MEWARRIGSNTPRAFGVVILFCVASTASHAAVIFPDFNSTSSLNLKGDASQVSGHLRPARAAVARNGAAWYIVSQVVGEGFETEFQFQFTNKKPGGYGADGLAFVIQNTSLDALGGNGNLRGYGGIGNSVAIDFANYDFSDYRRIGIALNGNPGNTIAETRPSINFTNGAVHTAHISYIPGTIKVYLDSTVTPLLSSTFDISSALTLDNGRAWIGFTAGTGSDYQNHDVLNWSFTSTPEPGFGGSLICLALGLRRSRSALSS